MDDLSYGSFAGLPLKEIQEGFAGMELTRDWMLDSTRHLPQHFRAAPAG
jgi:hypothetical protein